jgi:hypothetical protein
MSCKVAKLQLTVYTLQLSQNNSFSTIIQLQYNYTHDVMLMSLIVIHLLYLTHDIMKIFKHKKNSKYFLNG